MSVRSALTAGLLLVISTGIARADGALAADSDRRLMEIAREAIPLIAAIDAFHKSHGDCPQPDRPGDLAEFCAGLADGYTAERHGRFIMLRQPQAIPGWFYDTSAAHPGACSLWRKLGWDPALIWRRDGDKTGWALDPGNGSDERPLRIDVAPPDHLPRMNSQKIHPV